MTTRGSFQGFRLGSAVLVALGILLGGDAVAADDWPVFTPGLWETTREMSFGDGEKEPPLRTRRCADPSAEMGEQRAKLTQGGCRFSPVVRSGKDYRYSADCKMRGMSTVSRSVLTASSAGAYEIRIESEFGGEVTREVLRARRVGDCPR